MSSLLTDSGAYATYMSSFFGNLDPSSQQSLWEQYLTINGLTANPPQDTTDEQGFVQYLQGLYAQQTLNSQLSPDATTQRSVITATFDTILQMLTTLTNTVAEQANNLIFLGNYQNAYTQMLTNVPILTGGQNNTWTLPNDTTNPADVQPLTSTSQLSNFTLGYDNISIQDIAQYMANIDPTTQTVETSQGFVMSTPSPSSTQFLVLSQPDSASPSNQIGFLFQYVPTDSDANATSNGQLLTFQLTVSVVQYSAGLGPLATPSSNDYPEGVPSYITPYQVINTLPISSATLDLTGQANLTFSQKVTDIENLFLQAYNNGLAQNALQSFANQGLTPNIPWQADANVAATSTDTTAAQTSTQLQGEINTQDQEYVENARSYRTTIQNTAQAMQSNLSQTQQAISQESSLLTSMLDTLNTLISAIFTPS